MCDSFNSIVFFLIVRGGLCLAVGRIEAVFFYYNDVYIWCVDWICLNNNVYLFNKNNQDKYLKKIC